MRAAQPPGLPTNLEAPPPPPPPPQGMPRGGGKQAGELRPPAPGREFAKVSLPFAIAKKRKQANPSIAMCNILLHALPSRRREVELACLSTKNQHQKSAICSTLAVQSFLVSHDIDARSFANFPSGQRVKVTLRTKELLDLQNPVIGIGD